MSDKVIKVENIFKEYRLGVIDSGYLIKDMQSWWARIRGRQDPNSKFGTQNNQNNNTNGSILALNDVSFEVKQGEILGIIGRNGAGKSTLLKILSRVTTPTKGSVKIKGRIGSLLEVGTGFHPELTGKENIYLNGAILGMRRYEIDMKLDEIVAFAEIEKFMDTPVKRYSSGMYVRLAFAVAAHLDPEILVVDEVLAVGDAEFQKKCLGKMGDIAQGGRTVLFVSHNMEAVKILCSKGMLLSMGRVNYYGSSDEAVSNYLQNKGNQITEVNNEDVNTAPGNDYIRIKNASVKSLSNDFSENISISDNFCIELEYWNKTSKKIIPSFCIYDEYGHLLAPSFSLYSNNEETIDFENLTGDLINCKCFYPSGLFNTGMYSVNFLFFFWDDYHRTIYSQKQCLFFEIKDDPIVQQKLSHYHKPPGILRLKLNWEIQKING